MSLDKIRKEEEEFEKLMFPEAKEEESSEVEETTEDLPKSEDIEETEEEESSQVETTFDLEENSEETEEEPEKKQRTSWKKRYINYKSSTDQKLFLHRREIADLKEQIVRLNRLNDALTETVGKLKGSKDAFSEVITPEDEEILGSEAIEVMKRAISAANKDTKAELEELKREKKRLAEKEAEYARESSMQDLRGKLTSIVPGWEEVDLDPKFGDYLQKVDPLSGYTRQVLFANSIQSGDVEGVARFYKGFIETLPPTKESILKKRVTPTGGSHSTVDDSRSTRKKTYSIREYEAAYAALNRGDFRSKDERINLEKKVALLDKAFVEGRITD